MQKQFFSLLLLLSALTARAASDGINAMLLQGPSDYKFSILLDDQPVVTFSDDYLVVSTHMTVVSIPSHLVTKWTYVQDEEATGINNASRFGSLLSFDGKHIGMTNLAPSTAVQVYTADGALVTSGTTDSRGNVSLTVPERQGAVYVVKTSTVTFKVSKP
ncbi:MAG: hypothetical protein IKQ37_07150 [Bacteroidaceae bacterium]|nr:hypothetical protein [Bacteroidaceae bacterium]